MAIIGFIVLILFSGLLLVAAFVMLQMCFGFGSVSRGDRAVIAIFICLSLGGFYLAYQYAPFEITVKSKTT